jgi:hypothetical protein
MFYFWGVVVDLEKYIFLWQRCFIWGIVLDSSKYGKQEASSNKGKVNEPFSQLPTWCIFLDFGYFTMLQLVLTVCTIQ